jgi:hypothetical protein
MVSKLCSSLLESYDVVIHSDVDELLVADPEVAANLQIFASLWNSPVSTAVGLNVVHDPVSETKIDTSRIISSQRDSIWFVAVMCKPMMIRRPVKWRPGFHSCNARIEFAPIYNFHLRYYDVDQGLARLRKTRSMERAQPGVNAHQAIPDEQWLNDFKYGIGAQPKIDNITLKLEEDPLRGYLSKIEDDQFRRRNEDYKLDLDMMEKNRWKIPSRFVGSF